MDSVLIELLTRLEKRSDFLCPPFSGMTQTEKRETYELLKLTYNEIVCENYTRVDPLQEARLNYNLGKLAEAIGNNEEIIYYRKALRSLTEAGIDLSIEKWMKLVTLKTAE